MSEETQKEEALYKGPCVQIRGYLHANRTKMCSLLFIFFE